MDHYAGVDVSLEASSVCFVDGAGKIVREAKIASEPAALIGLVRLARGRWASDRLGGWAAVAMALRGDEGGGLAVGTAGAAACAHGAANDAGQDRPQTTRAASRN